GIVVGEIDYLRTFGADAEGGEDEVDFAALERWDSVGSGYAGELDLVGASERVRGDLLGEADLDALRLALRIEVAIRGIIAFHADAQQSLLFDCLWRGGKTLCGRGRTCCERQAQRQRQGDHRVLEMHVHLLLGFS